MMKKVVLTSIVLGILVPGIISCTVENRHQFELEYDKSAKLTVVCDNCYYYSGSWDTPINTTMVDRIIDGSAIELFSDIKFCGLGDTTPDGSLNIVTDTGSVAGVGIIFPNEEQKQSLRIQTSQTGLGEGCKRKDQEAFEQFFQEYATKRN